MLRITQGKLVEGLKEISESLVRSAVGPMYSPLTSREAITDGKRYAMAKTGFFLSQDGSKRRALVNTIMISQVP